MRKKQVIFSLPPGSTIRTLAHDIGDYLIFEEGMRCILMRTQSGAYIVQARSGFDEIAGLSGLGRGLCVRLTPVRQDRVRVDLIREKETGKRLLLAAGLLFSGGAAIAAVCGMVRHRLLLRRVDRLIRDLLC